MLIAFVFGTVVGSFLNVCIWRLPRDESLVKPGSHCPECDTLLRPRDLVPLLSFLWQRCRCRYCGAKISWRYFGVELLTGLYFVFTYWRFGFTLDTLQYALFGAALIAIFFIDLEHYIIPDQLSLFGIGLGIAFDLIGLATGAREPIFRIYSVPVPASIVGALVSGFAFLAIAIISYYIFKKEGVGGGDIKLAAAIGANMLLGQAFLSFFIAVFVGSVIGIALIALKIKSRKDYVPFGPMMVVGALVSIFYGREIIRAWLVYSGLDVM